MYFQTIPDKLSLYIHIPFCKSKCGYCDFYSKASTNEIELFIKALKQEIKLHLKENPSLAMVPLETIFFGGGTPSILSSQAWEEIATLLHHSFHTTKLLEWTIECNPESFTEEKARAWLQSGVTRISFGVQSLNPKELRASNRVHSRETVLSLLEMPILAEFDSISVDVIYGLPEQTKESLQETLDTLLSYPIIKHISAYELTIAEGTPFETKQESLNLPTEEFIEELTEITYSTLKKAGFNRYEVSNYCKENYQCKHNLNYWNLTPYLSLGPSAHSFDGRYRFANSSSLTEYCQKLWEGIVPISFSEELTPDMVEAELLFLSLRKAEGIDTEQFEKLLQKPFREPRREKIVKELQEKGLLQQLGKRFFLTEKGLDFADGVAGKLLL